MASGSVFGAPVFGVVLVGLLLACSADPKSSGSHAGDTSDEASARLATPLAARGAFVNGSLLGVKRYRGGAPQQAATPQCASPKVTYFGGPVVQSPLIVPVFWNSNVSAVLRANMPQFYADVMQSSYWTWLHEYDTPNQTLLPGSVSPAVTLVPSRCPASTTTTCGLTDAQLQSELLAQIANGNLPAPTLDCTGNVRSVYMVEFPANVTLNGPPGVGKSCSAFCAYHNTGTYGTNTPLVYAALMDQFTSACSVGCGADATPLENSTDVASHELIEAVSDPDVGLDLQADYAAPAAWADNDNGCGEIADICDADVAGDVITVSGRSWVVQQIWSNRQAKCTSSGSAPPVCSGTTRTDCRNCACADDGGACTGATPVCETNARNALFGSCVGCTATSANCPSGSRCQQSATLLDDDVCVTSSIGSSGGSAGTGGDASSAGLGGSSSAGTSAIGGSGSGGASGATQGGASDAGGGSSNAGGSASAGVAGALAGGAASGVGGGASAGATGTGGAAISDGGIGGADLGGIGGAPATGNGGSALGGAAEAGAPEAGVSNGGSAEAGAHAGGAESAGAANGGSSADSGGSSAIGGGSNASGGANSGTGAGGNMAAPNEKSGCSCELAGAARGSSHAAVGAFAALALLCARRRARRRSETAIFRGARTPPRPRCTARSENPESSSRGRVRTRAR